MIRRVLFSGLFSASPSGMRETPYPPLATAERGRAR